MQPCSLMKPATTVVKPSAEYRARASLSPTNTLSAPNVPREAACSRTPAPPSTTAWTSSPSWSASWRAAVTTSCAAFRSSPSRASANAKMPAIELISRLDSDLGDWPSAIGYQPSVIRSW